MSATPPAAEHLRDFESFWNHFLKSHQNPATRWAHVAALAVGVLAVRRAIKKRSLKPLLLGGAAFAGLAVLSHRLLDGTWPENFGEPVFATRAFLRLCMRTVSGRVHEDLAALAESSESV